MQTYDQIHGYKAQHNTFKLQQTKTLRCTLNNDLLVACSSYVGG